MKHCFHVLLAAGLTLVLTGCSTTYGRPEKVKPVKPNVVTKLELQERSEIEQAVAEELSRVNNAPVTANVKHLRIRKGWGWAVAFPTAAGGMRQYEPAAGLLRKEGRQWKVIYRIDNEALAWVDSPAVLKSKFPKVPPEVFDYSHLR